jgi:hypothetical protein
MTLHRRRKRLGLRPVTVIVSEREIDFLLARHYSSPARTTLDPRMPKRSRRSLPRSPCARGKFHRCQ